MDASNVYYANILKYASKTFIVTSFCGCLTAHKNSIAFEPKEKLKNIRLSILDKPTQIILFA